MSKVQTDEVLATGLTLILENMNIKDDKNDTKSLVSETNDTPKATLYDDTVSKEISGREMDDNENDNNINNDMNCESSKEINENTHQLIENLDNNNNDMNKTINCESSKEINTTTYQQTENFDNNNNNDINNSINCESHVENYGITNQHIENIDNNDNNDNAYTTTINCESTKEIDGNTINQTEICENNKTNAENTTIIYEAPQKTDEICNSMENIIKDDNNNNNDDKSIISCEPTVVLEERTVNFDNEKNDSQCKTQQEDTTVIHKDEATTKECSFSETQVIDNDRPDTTNSAEVVQQQEILIDNNDLNQNKLKSNDINNDHKEDNKVDEQSKECLNLKLYVDSLEFVVDIFESRINDLTQYKQRHCKNIDDIKNNYKLMESNFSDIFKTMERLKNDTKTLENNVEKNKNMIEHNTQVLKTYEQYIGKLKLYDQTKTNELNNQISKLKNDYEFNIQMLESSIAKEESKIKLLEDSLNKKNDDNKELSDIVKQLQSHINAKSSVSK